MESDPKSGRPSTTKTAQNIHKVNQLESTDRRLAVRMILEELSLNWESVLIILVQELGMRKVCTKMVPKLLSDYQKEHQVNACRGFLEKIREDLELLGQVTTGDETWV